MGSEHSALTSAVISTAAIFCTMHRKLNSNTLCLNTGERFEIIFHPTRSHYLSVYHFGSKTFCFSQTVYRYNTVLVKNQDPLVLKLVLMSTLTSMSQGCHSWYVSKCLISKFHHTTNLIKPCKRITIDLMPEDNCHAWGMHHEVPSRTETILIFFSAFISNYMVSFLIFFSDFCVLLSTIMPIHRYLRTKGA